MGIQGHGVYGTKQVYENEQRRTKEKKEDDERDAKGTTITFRDDNSMSISGQDETTHGTYEVSGKMIYITREHAKTEKARILMLNTTTLKIHDEGEGIIVIFTRMD